MCKVELDSYRQRLFTIRKHKLPFLDTEYHTLNNHRMEISAQLKGQKRQHAEWNKYAELNYRQSDRIITSLVQNLNSINNLL